MESIKDLSLEELIEQAVEMENSLADIEAGIKTIKDEIGDRFTTMKIDGTETKNGYRAQKIRMMNFRGCSLADARPLGATTNKEVVDTDMLKKLHEKGVKVPGAKMVVYVKITDKK